jgi:hypothetical protein
VYDNWVLKGLFDLRVRKRQENGENCMLTPSADSTGVIKRRMGYVGLMEDNRNAYEIVDMTPEGKRPLGTPNHRWEDDIKMDFKGYNVFIWFRKGCISEFCKHDHCLSDSIKCRELL